jgi:lysozyme family protein
MPSLFTLAIPAVLQHEGGFVNDAADPGGATDFGVSLRWLKAQGLLTELEHSTQTDDPILAVKKMTQADASGFYFQFWWDAYKYTTIDSQPVANKILDLSVNLGAPRAHRMVQSAIGVKADGVLGMTTYGEINHTSPASLILTLKNTQASFYRNLVAAKPQMNVFLAGWLKRAAYGG